MDEQYMERVYENHLAARREQREVEGRCGTCGAMDGPDHLCPHLIQLHRQVREVSRDE